MPKEMHEISKFMTGTVLTPSERDISDDAASDSLNIDPISEDGVLKGINVDKTVTTKLDADNSGALDPIPMNASKIGVLNASGKKELVYWDSSDSKMKLVDELSNSNINQSNISTSAESYTGTPDMEANNQEVHIGMGNAEANKPLWIGRITNKQFGTAIAATTRQVAELEKPGNLPPMDKVIKVGSYLIGAQDHDTRVYSMTTDGVFYKSSFDIFQDIRAIAFHNGTSFWVLDKISSTSAELKLVDATSFEVTQTSTITNIDIHGDKSFDDAMDGDDEEKTFAEWFEASGDDGTGGGADFITDMVETNGYMWYARGCGLQTNPDNMIRWRFLFKGNIPTQTGTLAIQDVSFRTDHQNAAGSANAPANQEGTFYNDSGTGASADISVRLQLPYKCLVDAGSGAGLIVQAFNKDSSAANQKVFLYATGVTGSPKVIAFTEDSVGVTYRIQRMMYFSDENYYPGTGSYWSTAEYTNQRLDSSAGTSKGAADDHSYKSVWLVPSAYSHYVVGGVNFQGDNTLSFTYYITSNLKKAYTGVYTANNFHFAYNSGGTGASDWNGQGLKSNSTHLDHTEVSQYEIRHAYPYAEDTGSGTIQYLLRSSKDATDKKFQIIKNTNADGSTPVQTYAKETDISVGFTETGSDASWVGGSNAKKIFYKFSFMYDGYQESPLGNTFIHILSSATQARLRLAIKLHNIADLSKRITHLNVYNAVSSNSEATGPDGFYRLVDSIRLDTGWTDGTSDEDGSLNPAWGATKEKEILHNGKVSGSYESRTGINEQVDRTIPNYSLSTALNNQLYVGNCYHSEYDDASNYIFKSKPYNFSQFDWSTDYLVMPTTPTAISAFMGRVYAFDEDNMYRIEPNNLYIEDVLEGVGCLGQHAIATSDYGMCFCDEDNIYLHDGKKANPIGDRILRGDTNSWESKDSVKSVVFDTFRKAFIIFFVNSSSENRAWVYSVLRNRWDLWESGPVTAAISRPNNVVSYITTSNSASVLLSNGTNLITYLGDDSSKRAWNWTSKKIHMGENTNDKKFYKIKTIGTPSGTLGNASAGIYAKIDDADFVEGGTLSNIKVPGSNSKGKQLQVFLRGQTGSVDAIGVLFRRLKPK